MGPVSSESAVARISLPSLLVIIVIGYILHCFVQYSHLRQFKGPRTTGFSKLWLLKIMRAGRMHLDFTKVNEKYGRYFQLRLVEHACF